MTREASDEEDDNGYLEGQLLIATPQLSGSCFAQSVIYICAHTTDGAMGIIVNHLVDSIDADEIFSQLNITIPREGVDIPVHFGGPVDTARGFVLHSTDYTQKETILMSEDIALTSNIDILKDISGGKGPKKCILALGYAGWSPGQLESELETNSWLTTDASRKILFNTKNDEKWEHAASSMGIDLTKLSGDVGHA